MRTMIYSPQFFFRGDHRRLASSFFLSCVRRRLLQGVVKFTTGKTSRDNLVIEARHENVVQIERLKYPFSLQRLERTIIEMAGISHDEEGKEFDFFA